MSLLQLGESRQEQSLALAQKTKFAFLLIVAVSATLAVGFTVWKHKYRVWEAKIDAEALENYERELYRFTSKTKELFAEMKAIISEALRLDDAGIASLDEELVAQSKRLANFHGEEDVVTSQHEEDHADQTQAEGKLNEKREEIMYAQTAYAFTKKSRRDNCTPHCVARVRFDRSGCDVQYWWEYLQRRVSASHHPQERTRAQESFAAAQARQTQSKVLDEPRKVGGTEGFASSEMGGLYGNRKTLYAARRSRHGRSRRQ